MKKKLFFNSITKRSVEENGITTKDNSYTAFPYMSSYIISIHNIEFRLWYVNYQSKKKYISMVFLIKIYHFIQKIFYRTEYNRIILNTLIKWKKLRFKIEKMFLTSKLN